LASPQIENGFTKVANELLEQIVQFKFNGTQYKIILVIWRYTYGFNRPQHEFSNKFFAEATGANDKTVKKELTKLLESEVLIEVAAATFTSGRIITFNKDYEKWKIERTKDPQGANYGGGGQLTPTIPTDPQGNDRPPGEGANTPPGEGANTPPKKESINKGLKKANNTTDDLENNPLNFYCNNFGMPSPYIMQSINDWEKDFNNLIVIEAFKRALNQNKRTWGYAESILKDWSKNNVKSMADIEALDVEFNNRFANKQQGRYKKPVRTEKLPEWYENPGEKKETDTQDGAAENYDFEEEKRKLEQELKEFRDKQPQRGY
jgi:phage replication O-like protein O